MFSQAITITMIQNLQVQVFKGVPGNDSAPAASPGVAKSVTPNIPSLNNNEIQVLHLKIKVL